MKPKLLPRVLCVVHPLVVWSLSVDSSGLYLTWTLFVWDSSYCMYLQRLHITFHLMYELEHTQTWLLTNQKHMKHARLCSTNVKILKIIVVTILVCHHPFSHYGILISKILSCQLLFFQSDVYAGTQSLGTHRGLGQGYRARENE